MNTEGNFAHKSPFKKWMEKTFEWLFDFEGIAPSDPTSFQSFSGMNTGAEDFGQWFRNGIRMSIIGLFILAIIAIIALLFI